MSQESKTQKFAKGLYINPPSPQAPGFVFCNISVKTEEFIAFLKENTNDKGYCNINVTRTKADASKLSSTLNEWVKSNTEPNTAVGGSTDDDLPF